MDINDINDVYRIIVQNNYILESNDYNRIYNFLNANGYMQHAQWLPDGEADYCFNIDVLGREHIKVKVYYDPSKHNEPQMFPDGSFREIPEEEKQCARTR